MDKDLERLEEVLKLMRKYNVNAVKMGDIEVAGLIPVEVFEEGTKPAAEVDLEADEDILFHSAEF